LEACCVADTARVAQQVQLTPDSLQAALKTLIDHDVIQQQEQQYTYKVELMRRWVAMLVK
jgi:DNA-binding IclR family transcriptional regulator